jgi:large subunit ribosomal protein L5
VSRLEQKYKDEIIPSMQKALGVSNPMQVPKIEKIVINMGLDSSADKKILQNALEEMKIISGQSPVVCNARKSVASFKIREGNPIGCKVTLRRKKMYEFLDRLISIAIPRVRDFRGLNNKSFDGRGNYSLGLSEQIVFPEIDFEKVTKIKGMDISIITTTQSNEYAKKLLEMFDFPFKN